MKKILITGAGGFIGTNLCEKLDKLDYATTGLSLNKFSKKFSNIMKVRGNINDEKLIVKLVSDADFIIHLAAYSDVKKSFSRLDEIFRTNIMGTFNILKNISLLKGKPNFIFISSSTVYGNKPHVPIHESFELDPTTPFAMSKIMSEMMCRGFGNSYDIPITILRPFTIYGPGAPSHQLIPKILNQMLKDGKITLDNPNQMRDFLFIDDLVAAIILTIKKPSNGFRIYNVGSGKGTKLLEVSKKMAKILSWLDIQIGNGNITELDKKKNIADISLIKKDIGWKPKTSLSEGLVKTLKFQNPR